MIGVSVFLGIMRLRVSDKDFWAGLIAVGITGIIGQLFFSVRELPIICTVIAAIAFLTSHFIRNGCRFEWETRGGKNKNIRGQNSKGRGRLKDIPGHEPASATGY